MSGDRGADRPVEPAGPRDPGLAGERTELAWTRTAVAFAAVGAAMLRADPPAGVVVLVLSSAVWSLGRLATAGRRAGGAARTVRLITLATTLVAVTALALALQVPA